jgi:hypothetical protein
MEFVESIVVENQSLNRKLELTAEAIMIFEEKVASQAQIITELRAKLDIEQRKRLEAEKQIVSPKISPPTTPGMERFLISRLLNFFRTWNFIAKPNSKGKSFYEQ